jgi:hypothetical protein
MYNLELSITRLLQAFFGFSVFVLLVFIAVDPFAGLFATAIFSAYFYICGGCLLVSSIVDYLKKPKGLSLRTLLATFSVVTLVLIGVYLLQNEAADFKFL